MRKEKNRSVIYIAIFVALIMALSVIGFLWGKDGESSYKYGRFAFANKNGVWITQADGKELSFSYLPEDVASIQLPAGTDSLFSGARMVYVTYSPDDNSEELALAQFSLDRNLETPGRFVANAFTAGNENNLPVITCQNASAFVPVIMLEKTESDNSLTLNNSCMTLSGNPQMLADRLVYSVYRIIE